MSSLPRSSCTSTSSGLLQDLIRSFVSRDNPSLSKGNAGRKHKHVFLLDGGTGEELMANGVPYDSKIWSARAITEKQYHTTLQKVHTSFITSGCDAITTNSYGIVPGVGFTKSEIAQYCATAGHIARCSVQAASLPATSLDAPALQAAANDPTFVLGSLGPLVESYRADNIMSRVEGVEYYTITINALHPFVDAYIAETLSSSEEAIQVLQSLSNHVSNADDAATDLLFISFTVNTDGHLRGNGNILIAISRVLDYHTLNCSTLKLLGILINCSEPEAITKALHHINCDVSLLHRLRSCGIALGAYANRLIPIPNSTSPDSVLESTSIRNSGDENITTNSTGTSDTPQPQRNDLSPGQYYIDFVQEWVTNFNVSIIGGCCGISPRHIKLLHEQFK